MNHIHFTYEPCNTQNYSIIFKTILTRRVPTVDLITILVALKGSYNCVIAQFIAHNSIHTSQYTCISPLITGSNYHNMGSKTPQIISHNYIKIMGQNTKTSKALKFINQYLSEHQLVHKTQ